MKRATYPFKLSIWSIFEQYCFRLSSLFKVRQNDVGNSKNSFFDPFHLIFHPVFVFFTQRQGTFFEPTTQNNLMKGREGIDWNWNTQQWLTQLTSLLFQTVKCETILFSGENFGVEIDFLWMGHRLWEMWGSTCNFIGSTTCYLLKNTRFLRNQFSF